MYIYVQYEDDFPNGLAFHKAETAVEYVIEKVEENIGIRKKKAPIPKPSSLKKKPTIRFTVPALDFEEAIGVEPRIHILEQQHPPLQAFDEDVYGNQPQPAMREIQNTMLDLLLKPKKHSKKEEDPKYLLAVKEQIAITTANKSIENANKLIDQYDTYMKNVFGVDCPLHTIQEIEIENGQV